LRIKRQGLGSLEGCKIVAGGRSDHRNGFALIVSTLTECEMLRFRARQSWHPFRVRTDQPCSGGLRFASTSGYFLTTLRVAKHLHLYVERRYYSPEVNQPLYEIAQTKLFR